MNLTNARIGAGLLAAMMLGAAPARATDLIIGRATEQNSIDPQFSDLGNDVATAENMFESMIEFNSKLQIHPSLAVSWKLLDPLTWEIKLRPDVTFHDGTPFTGEDVAFSLKRARDVPNSPGPLSSFVRPVKQDRGDQRAYHTHPHRPADAATDGHGGAHLCRPREARNIGSHRGLRLRPRHDRHRALSLQAVAAGRSRGDVEANPTTGASRPPIAGSPWSLSPTQPPAMPPCCQGQWMSSKGNFHHLTFRFFRTVRPGAVFGDIDTHGLSGDGSRARRSPFLTDKDGNPLTVNPLKDRRVRLALSKLINRQAIVERVSRAPAKLRDSWCPTGWAVIIHR